MDYTVIALRIIHILCGVFWVGSIFMFAMFLYPAVHSAGPEGGKFMGVLVKTRRLPTFMSAIAGLSLVSGLWLYWIDSDGLSMQWIHTGFGHTLTAGGVFALLAFTFGVSIVRPSADRLGKIGAEIAASGAPPTPAHMQAIGALRMKMYNWTKVMAWLLSISVVLMSIARYIV